MSDSAENHWIRVEPPPTGATVLLGQGADADQKALYGFSATRRISAPVIPYEIQQHEVSWGELEPWLAANPSQPLVDPPAWAPRTADARKALPVAGIAWNSAWAYCRSIGGAPPSEAQWEYAARGPARRANPWGDEQADFSRIRIYGGASAKPAPVMTSDQDVTPGGGAVMRRRCAPGSRVRGWELACGGEFAGVRGTPPPVFTLYLIMKSCKPT